MRLPPPGNRTFAIAESGVLSAVGCVLYLCWYNPILYPVSVTLTPMPLTLLAYRYGARVGLAGLGCTAVSIAAFLGPPDAFLYTGLFGVIGLLTGWLLHRGKQPGRVLIEGSIAVCLYDVFAYYCLERLFGLEDSLAPIKDGMLDYLKQTAAAGPPALAAHLMGLHRQMTDFFVFPLALFFGVAFLAFVANYIISTVVLRQLGLELPLPPGLMMFRLAPWLGALCLAVLALGAAAASSSVLALRVAYMNVSFVILTFLAVEAWSVFLCVLNLSPLRLGPRLLAMVAFLIVCPVWWIIGLADSFFDLRSFAVSLLG